MVKVEYANAYKEVLDILKYVSKEDLNKIPTKKIEMFSKYANYDYDFEYNPEITLKEQNVSDIAQTIIAILFRDYWATKTQRNKIISKSCGCKLARKRIGKISDKGLTFLRSLRII